MMTSIMIAAAVRTPIGRFGGALSGLTATELGAAAIREALKKAALRPGQVEEVFMGNVLSAGLGQAPATQSAVYAGLAPVPATTINKVCASGMKAIMLSAQNIALGHSGIIAAGGMESMSQVPYYLDKARFGYRIGHGALTDGLIKDGLWDVYSDQHMGKLAELCAFRHRISRSEQDDYAIGSYRRAQAAQLNGHFASELISVEVKGQQVNRDEEPELVNFEKLPNLKPVFQKDGTITAANASTLNDGAAALILLSRNKAEATCIEPLARICAYADAQLKPEDFTIAPAKAINKALALAGLTIQDIDLWEINEAFSVVALANIRLLKLDPSKVNINGGAVALGHPLGASGARIVVTLLHALKHRRGRYGVAAICNGGGGASAIIVERL